MPTVFVTGANRGLGFEHVKQYAHKEWKVIACARNPEKADQLKTYLKAQHNADNHLKSSNLSGYRHC